MKTDMILTFRPHHLLCIQGFIGYGYSPDFVRYLTHICTILKEDPDTKVRITDSVDDICCHCPYNNNGVCTKYSSAMADIKNMDTMVLRMLNIEIDVIYKFSDLKKRIDSTIRYRETADQICGNCQWHEVCRWYQSRLVKMQA